MNSPQASTISEINRLPAVEKKEIYTRAIPVEIFERFHLNPYLVDAQGRDLFEMNCPNGASTAELAVYHQYGFPDPVVYGHITDTLNGQIHILLYVLNDPGSPRFDVDRMPDGTPTLFGTQKRNLEAELAALRHDLAPGQIRHGLRLLRQAMVAFENFVASLGHDLYFAEPLYYHNAVLFERNGFAYSRGKRLMERIQAGFLPEGEFARLLTGSSPFRQPEASSSVRLRSWAIHDGILGEPFTNVTMYKRVGKHAGVTTTSAIHW